VINYRFTVPSGNVKQYIFVEPGIDGSVEAIPLRDVPALRPEPGTAALR